MKHEPEAWRSERPMWANDYITVASGMSGYFAVYIRYYNNIPNYDLWYPDVLQTGVGRYSTYEEALNEAYDWGTSEGIQVKDDRTKAKPNSKSSSS